jgi:DeoR/GlpR family transcriptional regulator of sugar metabolism
MSEKLFPEERLDRILNLMGEKGRVSVTDLSRQFDVSTVTIRNDLAQLERQGRVVRTHGGAMVRPDPIQEPAFSLRQRIHSTEKERIARAAADLVGMVTIVLMPAPPPGTGSLLKDRHELTVITNGLFNALELSDSPGVAVVMPGGMLRSGSTSLVGDLGAAIFDLYHIQKGFFSAWGLTLQEGLTDLNQYEVELKRLMVERSKEVIAIIDATKWGQVAFSTFASLNQVDQVISDAPVPLEMVASLEARGIKSNWSNSFTRINETND